jgi:type IV pilus assembly protein PilV
MDATDMTRIRKYETGSSMIEVLVSLVVLLLGLLGLCGLQAKVGNAEMESYQRAQAVALLQDIVDRMNVNRTDTHTLVYKDAMVGTGDGLVDCAGKTGANRDLCEWGNLLKGAAEVTANGACSTTNRSNCVGAMIGARGCVIYDATTELTNTAGAVLPGTGVYTISVAWQGLTPTVAPASTLACGANAYGDESRRRVVTSTLRIADLAAI